MIPAKHNPAPPIDDIVLATVQNVAV